MRGKFLLKLSVIAAVLLGGTVAARAQMLPLRGKVILAQADGSKAPLAGAIIDVYRTDAGGKWEVKTDKNGTFTFAGLPLVGVYVISASAPNARPEAVTGVRLTNLADGELPSPVTLVPGDGKRFTVEEAKAAAVAGPRAPENTAEKARRAEEARKIEEANRKNLNINEVLNRTFKAGKDAIAAKNYDEAIKQFEEGLAADPTQVVLYSQKAGAYRRRGVDHYNAYVRGTDQAARTAELEKAKSDFQTAAEEATKGVELAKKEPAAADPASISNQTMRKLESLTERAESMRLYTKTDPSQVDNAAVAYQEYMAAETDLTKKSQAQLTLAQMLLDAGAADKAIVEFQKILAVDPDNVDALYGMGVSQINIGYASNDNSKLQEAINYLQRFVDRAPDTNKYKLEAKATIEEMKREKKLEPQKTSTPARRRRP